MGIIAAGTGYAVFVMQHNGESISRRIFDAACKEENFLIAFGDFGPHSHLTTNQLRRFR